MKLAIGCDHAAVELKQEIMSHLQNRGVEVEDFGTYTNDSCDYPIYAEKVANEVVSKRAYGGILICGTGVGISIAANKVKGVRCVVCSEPFSAKLSKMHNNTNILAFGARVVGLGMAKMIVDAWLDAEYEGGRHQHRVDLIHEIEEKQN